MAKQSKNLKAKLFYLFSTVLIIAVFAVSGFLSLFDKLDYRLYDFLLHFRKAPPQSDKIVMVAIDDDSIENMGEWPWTRDVLGDCLIRMKELGAEAAVFDIEYLSPSKLGINSHARDNISKEFMQKKNTVVDLVNELSTAASSGFYKPEEIPPLTDELVNSYIEPSFDELEQNVNEQMYFDFDNYFAQAIQFFGNTWLTINTRDVGIKYDDSYLDYVRKKILDLEVDDKNDYITRDNDYTSATSYDDLPPGFCPAKDTFMTRANGSGFTNSIVDDDGTRRRYELIYRYGDDYVGQLVFAPFMRLCGVTKITREKNYYICHDCLLPGATEKIDLKIPVDEHGRVLINFIHDDFKSSFKFQPVMLLKILDWNEATIKECLDNILLFEVSGLDNSVLPYTDYAAALVEMYDDITAYKEELLSKCTGYDINGNPYDGITAEEYEDYFAYRAFFFENVKNYIDAHFEQEAYDVLDVLMEYYGDFAVEMKENLVYEFETLASNYENYLETFETLKPIYDGSFCIIGQTASSTSDIGATPFFKQYQNVGLHGNFLNTIINNAFITPVSWVWGFVFAVVLSMIPLFFRDDKKRYRNISGGIVLFVIVVTLVSVFVFGNIYIPFVSTLLFSVAYYLFGIVYRFVSSEKEKKFITNAFSQCLSPDVVNDIIKDPSSLKLGGNTRDMTAIFTDIQKFSAFSELLNAAELVALLNYYLTKMSDIIMDERGTVDKYEGDAIIALVGAPLDLPDHAFRACSAAIKMKKAEVIMNEEIVRVAGGEMPVGMDPNLYSAFQVMVKNGKSIFTRIGINSGEMVAGFMGSEGKKNYTMMGNNVNLASRLEGVNKAYASSMLCSQATWERANSGENKGKILFRRLDRVRVVNITTPVQLYNLIGFTDEITLEQSKEIEMFHSALDRYLEKDFANAEKLFKQANKAYHDDTALIFAERCKKYLKEGVPDGWDGVLNMTTK